MKTTSFNKYKFSCVMCKSACIINAYLIFLDERKGNFKLSQIACNFIFNLFAFCMKFCLHTKINIQMQAALAFQLAVSSSASNKIMFYFRCKRREIFLNKLMMHAGLNEQSGCGLMNKEFIFLSQCINNN